MNVRSMFNATLGCVCAFISAQAQQASFILDNMVRVNAPIYDSNGSLLWGQDWRVELYGGATANSLSPATAVFFADRPVIIPFAAPGYFRQSSGGEPTILGVTWAYLQVKVWDVQLGTTYEQALARGQGGYGQSSVFYALGGDETVGNLPQPLIGLTSFSVLQPLPEPATWALLALGLGGLVWCRRRSGAFGNVSLAVNPETNTTNRGKHEPGEHNIACADMNNVYLVWSDNRVLWTYHGTNTNVQGVSRYQADIRLARLPWPH